MGKLTGKQWTTAGACLQGRMLKAGLEQGIDVRLESPVQELIVEGGKVTGVVTVKDGKPWRIGGNLGVLVNAGGFAHNQAMRDKYMPGTRSEWSVTPEGDTGEMHQEMERIGGVLAQMDEMVGFPGTLPPGWEKDYVFAGMQGVTAKPGAILVDQAGVRFMNESCSYEHLLRNHAQARQCQSQLGDHGCAVSWRNMRWAAASGSGKKPKSWFDSGYLKVADTIEELAGKIGADSAALKATVDRWNAMMAKGADEDFQRGVRYYDQYLGDPFHKPNADAGPARTRGRSMRSRSSPATSAPMAAWSPMLTRGWSRPMVR